MGVVCLHISCDFPLSSVFSKSYASMKGTAVNNWLFGPVPCRASISATPSHAHTFHPFGRVLFLWFLFSLPHRAPYFRLHIRSL